MPIVQIHLLKGHSPRQKRQMVAEVTKAVVQSLKVPAEWVNIIISEMAATDNAVGGILISDMKQKTKKKR